MQYFSVLFSVCVCTYSVVYWYKQILQAFFNYQYRLLYGVPEKTKNWVQVVPPINKLPYEIL